MRALSTSTISASDSASNAAAKPGMRGADKSAGASPFATLLAATSQQSESQKPQTVNTQAANTDDKPAAKITQPQDRPAQAPQSSAQPHGDNVVSKDGGKRDKKADAGKEPDADAPSVAPQAPQTQAPVQTAIAATGIPFVAGTNSQTPGTAEVDAGPDAVVAASPPAAASSSLMAQASNANGGFAGNGSASVADLQPASQPVPMPMPVQVPVNGQNGPAAQNAAPAQIASADEDDSGAVDAAIAVPAAVPGVAKSDKPAGQNKTDGGSADKAAGIKSANNAPVDPQTLSQPAPTTDDDAEPAAQTVAIAPPAGASPIATKSGGDAVTTAQLANAVPPAQAAKSDAKDTGPANKPTQTAANSNTPSRAIDTPASAIPVTAVPGKASENGTDSLQTASSSNNDSKPVHVSAPDVAPQPQPDAPAPIPQAAPAPVLPQGMATADFGVTAPATGTSGGTVTTSVHIAAADADATPTLSALAVSVAARSLSGAKQFDIRLDPPELGRVDVRLSIDASGKTEAHMTADQPQTLSLLQKDAPTLTQALRDAGLDVSQSGLNFSLRGQDHRNDDGGNGAGQGRRTNLTATRAIQAAQNPTAISFNGAAADARVDIHV